MARSVSDIQADLDAFYAARRAIATGAQSYTIDTGQTKHTVTRANLSEINRTIDQLEIELDAAFNEANGGSGSEPIQFIRRPS